VGIYLIPYAASGSIHLFLHGIIGSTSARMTGLAGRQNAPGLGLAIYGMATMAVIAAAMYAEWTRRRKFVVLLAAVLAAVLACSVAPAQLQDTWLMAGTLTPLVVMLGVLLLARPGDAQAQQRLMLLISLAAVCSLVQFPFAYVTYFCYTAPLTLLAVVACVATRPNPPGRQALSVLLLFFLGFGVFGLTAKHVFNPSLRVCALHRLGLERAGGVRIDATTAGYEELIPFLQSHSPNGLLYAGNDCPELYFLSGLRNPTRDDTGAPVGEVLAALRSGDLRLVAINDASFFQSGTTAPELRGEIASTLPNSAKIGRFSIYWR
jgi:hypothetical protein